jgi:hypothetical protein
MSQDADRAAKRALTCRRAGERPTMPLSGALSRADLYTSNLTLLQNSSGDDHVCTDRFVGRPGAGVARRKLCAVLNSGEAHQRVVHRAARNAQPAEHLGDACGQVSPPRAGVGKIARRSAGRRRRGPTAGRREAG